MIHYSSQCRQHQRFKPSPHNVTRSVNQIKMDSSTCLSFNAAIERNERVQVANPIRQVLWHVAWSFIARFFQGSQHRSSSGNGYCLVWSLWRNGTLAPQTSKTTFPNNADARFWKRITCNVVKCKVLITPAPRSVLSQTFLANGASLDPLTG